MTTTEIIAPTYDRAALRPRILHLGFGGFARAHPMVFLNEGLAARGGDWGAVVARLHSGAEGLRALREADHLYHVAEADGDRIAIRRIGAVIGTLHPLNDGTDAIPDLMATEALALVTTTVTEKGYCAVNGRLDRDHPGVIGDLASPTRPGTAIGVLVEGLARRRAARLGGLTILSCDNLPENGALTRRVVLDFARACDADLAEWIEGQVRFPNSMVDRIVPAMGEEGHRILRDALGRDDPNGILCEPFRQWVIEDDFAAGRPPFAEGGAQIVADVLPFEEMKLRMLNGAHTALACLGQLLGHDTVADCMGDAALRRAIRHLMMHEQAPTLNMPDGVDLAAYAEALLRRFANPRLRHRLAQIATDTSQKIPQRLLAPAEVHLRRGTPWDMTALAIAGWIALLRRSDEIADPRADELRAASRADDPVSAILALGGIVPDSLRARPDFVTEIHAAHDLIQTRGVARIIATRAPS